MAHIFIVQSIGSILYVSIRGSEWWGLLMFELLKWPLIWKKHWLRVQYDLLRLNDGRTINHLEPTSIGSFKDTKQELSSWLLVRGYWRKCEVWSWCEVSIIGWIVTQDSGERWCGLKESATLTNLIVRLLVLVWWCRIHKWWFWNYDAVKLPKLKGFGNASWC